MTLLFEPFTLRDVTTRNRIWLAPMCQYSSEGQDGIPTDWHLVHLGARATGGFGLVMTEAAAVAPDGRITPEDAGIWADSQVVAWKRITTFIRSQGAVSAIQLAHAGRKASTASPWNGRAPVPPGTGGWIPFGPSPIEYHGLPVPKAMTTTEIAATVRAFAEAARRAVDAGFDVIEVHAAHGYLLHEFLSPLSNTRTDVYGGTFENRTCLVLEVVDAVRQVIPDGMPLLVRLSATDWVSGGWELDDTIELSALLAKHGVDLVDLSSGGNDAGQQISPAPGYQVPFAHDVRTKVGVPTAAVGLITKPIQANEILENGSADVVFLGRAALREPAWPLRAANELGVAASESPCPVQYMGAYRA